ncbi:unnamed protein product [Arctia plantaginis]|uniref:Uncharacterized protein n=1 Tax=Arctia plantaginis TaxID=874455 RepID=A0A8S1BGR2_ARCPL|nr:unnamed protein product [Arctia plantaginis]
MKRCNIDPRKWQEKASCRPKWRHFVKIKEKENPDWMRNAMLLKLNQQQPLLTTVSAISSRAANARGHLLTGLEPSKATCES